MDERGNIYADREDRVPEGDKKRLERWFSESAAPRMKINFGEAIASNEEALSLLRRLNEAGSRFGLPEMPESELRHRCS